MQAEHIPRVTVSTVAFALRSVIQLKAGDVVRMLTPGGGRWGTPTSNDI
ncbi:MAG: hypothetical protein JJE52_00445 [Acidimicrobiia bacterium]|nr:hypothetical protein [Acidimicrobiia bacterium]